MGGIDLYQVKRYTFFVGDIRIGSIIKEQLSKTYASFHNESIKQGSGPVYQINIYS